MAHRSEINFEAKKENPEADTSALESEIDQLACPPKPRRRRVYKLYNLTDEEVKIADPGGAGAPAFAEALADRPRTL